jgi:tRNA threonylcarbamoyladenosine biosynthesis protein TsaB
VIASASGDARATHGERLPGEAVDLLAAHGLMVENVDRFAVAVGPGSFTGLRVGIATIQGLALTRSCEVVGVSTLAAMAECVVVDADVLGVWLDGQRGDVFGAAYLTAGGGARAADATTHSITVPPGLEELEPHCVGSAAEVAGGWRDRIGRRSVVLAGDGAVRYAGEAEAALGQTVRILPMPAALAVGVGQLAVRATPTQRSPPHGIAPLYIRRPDAELARDQRTRGTSHR